MTELPELHAQALDYCQSVVDGVRKDQFGDDTPCEGWDVRALLHHIVYGNLWVPPLVEGETIEEVGDRFEGDIFGDDVSRAHAASAVDAAAAFRADGAMERPVAVSYGPVPGSVYCGHRFIDVLVHGWDLATATGGNTTMPATLVAECIEVVLPQAELFGASGMFGAVSDPGTDADPQRRLLALLGRQG